MPFSVFLQPTVRATSVASQRTAACNRNNQHTIKQLTNKHLTKLKLLTTVHDSSCLPLWADIDKRTVNCFSATRSNVVLPNLSTPHRSRAFLPTASSTPSQSTSSHVNTVDNCVCIVRLEHLHSCCSSLSNQHSTLILIDKRITPLVNQTLVRLSL